MGTTSKATPTATNTTASTATNTTTSTATNTTASKATKPTTTATTTTGNVPSQSSLGVPTNVTGKAPPIVNSTVTIAVPLAATSSSASTTKTAVPSFTTTPSSATTKVSVTKLPGGIPIKTTTVLSTKPNGAPTGVTKAVSTGNPTNVGTTSGKTKTSTSSLMSTSKPCRPPDFILNGYIKSSGPYYPNGTRAEYSCFPGYILQGASFIICTSGSLWSSLPPACIPVTEVETVNEHSSVDTDVDVDVDVAVQAGQGLTAEWGLPLAIIIGAIICLALLGFLLVWCCKASGCFHGNAVLPYDANYVVQGCCCCKRYGNMNEDQRAGSIRSTRPSKMPRPSITTQVPGYFDDTPVAYHDPGDAVGHAFYDPDSKVPQAKQPATWMPHAKPVRKINTSTK